MSQVIHVTDRRTFKNCRRKYRYAIVERLTTLEESVGALWIGTAGHFALANNYCARKANPKLGVDSLQAITNEAWYLHRRASEQKPNAEQEYLSTELLKRYVDHYFTEDSSFEIVAVEVPISLKFQLYEDCEIELVATIDLIVKWKGRLWIMDHKFLARLPSAVELEMDDQMTAYMWAAKQAGWNVAGAIYNVIVKDLPEPPERNQSDKPGKMLSRKKTSSCTEEMYLQAILAAGDDPSLYEDILSHLRFNAPKFFHREYITRSKRELELFELSLMAEFRDMSNPNLVYYTNTGEQCKRCVFQPLCKAENEGANGTLLRQSYYRLKAEGER